jgi:hypothetical protein
MANQSRSAPDDVQRPRHTLSLATWRGRNCSKLAAEQSNITEEEASVQRWADALLASRNVWDVARRSRGIVPADRRIHRSEADHKLRLGLAALTAKGRD